MLCSDFEICTSDSIACTLSFFIYHSCNNVLWIIIWSPVVVAEKQRGIFKYINRWTEGCFFLTTYHLLLHDNEHACLCGKNYIIIILFLLLFMGNFEINAFSLHSILCGWKTLTIYLFNNSEKLVQILLEFSQQIYMYVGLVFEGFHQQIVQGYEFVLAKFRWKRPFYTPFKPDEFQRVHPGAPVEVLRSERYLPTNSRWTPMKHRWTFEQRLPTSTPTR